MNTNISVRSETFKPIIEGRKMAFHDFLKNHGLEEKGSEVILESFNELESIAKELSTPIKDFFDNAVTNDLENGVKFGRKSDAFKRTVKREGTEYYTYNHLATTDAEPNLMALRVELHCKDDRKVVLNSGHGSKEIVYVTKGQVKVDWDYKGRKHAGILNEGDSLYIEPGVPHSFIANQDKSELIAVNY